jgi:ketosteroid isomerase-like protein
MSRQDVDLALALFAAYNAGDINAAVDLCAADVTAFPDVSFPELSSLAGRDELRDFWEESLSAWASGDVAPVKEVLDLGDGRVIVRGEWGGEGITSGVETYANLSTICTIRDGHISRLEYFIDHDAALKAVGRSE